jgi:hypothetical protein
MTKFLIALATTVALVGPITYASADALPSKMLGDWCATRNDTYVRGTCSLEDLEDGMIILGRDGFGNGDEYGCEFKSVLRLWDGSYFVRAKCSNGGEPRNEEMVLAVVDDELEIVTTSRTQDVYYVCHPRNGQAVFVNVENNGKRVIFQVKGQEDHNFLVTRSTLTTLVFSRGAFNYPTRSSPSFSMTYGGVHHECVQRHAFRQPPPPGEERGPPGPGPQGEQP